MLQNLLTGGFSLARGNQQLVWVSFKYKKLSEFLLYGSLCHEEHSCASEVVDSYVQIGPILMANSFLILALAEN